jgi:hypothetical protein
MGTASRREADLTATRAGGLRSQRMADRRALSAAPLHRTFLLCCVLALTRPPPPRSTLAFMTTVLPNPRPHCYARSFPPVPAGAWRAGAPAAAACRAAAGVLSML